MPEACSFRQVEEKHVSAEVEHMEWSPRMDLLALANVQGEVVLHRLTWQKVWSLAPPSEDLKVTALSWRPDGKVLAVGYNSGKLVLCDVENAAILHDLEMTSSVTSLAWVIQVNAEDQDDSKDCFHDVSSHVLPKLPQFPKTYASLGKGQSEENLEDAKRLKGLTDVNILVLGMEDGHLHMYAYGVFPMGTINLNDHGAGKSGQVLSGTLSQDLRLLSLLVQSTNEDGDSSTVYNITFDTTLLASRHNELRILAIKFGQVLTLMMYLDSTIQQMTEAWEDILLEMDSKLMKFAEEKHKMSSGTVSNDFLRLLMFGTPSDELQNFLLHKLTDKGLKKLGHSIETSYSNIQKLVLKHLQSVGQAMVYHLSDIRGMSLWYDKFGVLGLSTDAVQEAITMAGSFMLKASELQQVIDGSMKNFKAFFRWLYLVIKSLSDEPVPPELSKSLQMTQQDLNFVAQFLKENFTEEMDGNKSGFKLEKVGQYLKSEDLTDPPDSSGNAFIKFLEQNPNVAGGLYPAEKSKSLIQMYEKLQTSINAALNKCAMVIGQSLQCISTTALFSPSGEDFKPRISQFSKLVDEEKTYVYSVFTTEKVPCKKCYILRQSTTDDRIPQMTSIKFGEIGIHDPESSTYADRSSQHDIVDLSYYDSDTLSVLLVESVEDGLPVLVQVPLAALNLDNFVAVPQTAQRFDLNEYVPCIDIGSHIDNMNYRRLENMKASMFAVSGTRKVACVLFSSRRRVRLFLMDVEDEEDDDDEEDEEADQSQDQTREEEQNRTIEEDSDEDKENSRESAMDL